MFRKRKLWEKFAQKEYRDSFVSSHISSNIAEQISSLREAQGWTQKDLAEAAGMKQSRISLLENPDNDSVSVTTLKRIASACDVALVVRFVPFSNALSWALDSETGAVRTFSKDSLESSSWKERIATPVRGGAWIQATANNRSYAAFEISELPPPFVITSTALAGDTNRV
jgi:transcriptional regulator with XRE-family HTH domain